MRTVSPEIPPPRTPIRPAFRRTPPPSAPQVQTRRCRNGPSRPLPLRHQPRTQFRSLAQSTPYMQLSTTTAPPAEGLPAETRSGSEDSTCRAGAARPLREEPLGSMSILSHDRYGVAVVNSLSRIIAAETLVHRALRANKTRCTIVRNTRRMVVAQEVPVLLATRSSRNPDTGARRVGPERYRLLDEGGVQWVCQRLIVRNFLAGGSSRPARTSRFNKRGPRTWSARP